MPLSKDNNQLLHRLVTAAMGCDPELFLANNKGIIGAERVVQGKGLPLIHTKDEVDLAKTYPTADYYKLHTHDNKVQLDGVQLEIHPSPSHCRQSLAGNIRAIFLNLARTLEKEGLKASFNPVITVPKKELDALSEQAKVLGCQPSLNSHRPSATIKVAKRDLRMRSAGGHIHMGLPEPIRALLNGNKGKNAKPLVDLFDILVGLPCVLLDRDPQAARRRKIYGRAGEYRLPKHGIEYRVPSNFWLRHYYLMHFVMGQCTQAFDTFLTSEHLRGFLEKNGYRVYTPRGDSPIVPADLAADLLSRVDLKKVEKAINRNDLDLAKELWEPVMAWTDEHVPSSYGKGLRSGNGPAFDFFTSKIAENGLEYWFPEDPLKHWCSDAPGSGGFESFISSRVPPVMRNAEKKAA